MLAAMRLLALAGGAAGSVRFAYDAQKHPYDVACARDFFGAAGLVNASCFELNEPWLALENGEADVAIVDSTTLVTLSSARPDVVAVYVAHGTGTSEALMVGAAIESPLDLEGATFGTVAGWTTHFQLEFARLYLPRFDIETTDSQTYLLRMFTSGVVDGAFCRGAFCAELAAAGTHALLTAELFDNYGNPTFSVLATTRGWADAHADDLSTFLGVVSRVDENFVLDGPGAYRSQYWKATADRDGTPPFLAALADAHVYGGPASPRARGGEFGRRTQVPRAGDDAARPGARSVVEGGALRRRVDPALRQGDAARVRLPRVPSPEFRLRSPRSRPDRGRSG